MSLLSKAKLKYCLLPLQRPTRLNRRHPNIFIAFFVNIFFQKQKINTLNLEQTDHGLTGYLQKIKQYC